MNISRRHLLKPIRKNNELVIKTAIKPRGPSLPSKRPGQLIYETIKTGLKISGYYDEYELFRYDPDVLYERYAKKYTYKPRKRLTGYALQTQGFLRSKKKFRSRQYSQFNQERCGYSSGYNWNCNGSISRFS